MDCKPSENVIHQIKNSKNFNSLVDELIPDEELYGLCKGCYQPNTRKFWCQPCNSQRFQRNFNNWSSSNQKIDELIQKYQLEAINRHSVLEWIPYDKFTNIKYLA